MALISVFCGSTPQGLKRHAKWSVLTAVVILIAAVVFGLLFAGIGALVADLVNTQAVVLGRGSYFASADTAGSHFR